LKIEVAEQFHRRPYEQVKLALLSSGLFGKVHSSFTDFAGHGYHGVSVTRSYLGFGAVPVQVVGSVHDYPLAAHWSRLGGTHGPRIETQEHGMIEFEGGALGLFHWTSVGYDSALRWWRSSRFLAEKGMGIAVGVGLDVDERLSLLSSDGESPSFITLERAGSGLTAGAARHGGAYRDAACHRFPGIIHFDPSARTRTAVARRRDRWRAASSAWWKPSKMTENRLWPGSGAPGPGSHSAIRQSSQEGGKPVLLPLDPAAQTL
jgi:hypothetical protein